MRDLTVLTARRLIIIDQDLKEGYLKPVDWMEKRLQLFQTVLLYYDQAEGPAERVWCNAGKTLLRYQLYKEDIPKQAIDRAMKQLVSETESMDIVACSLWDALTTDEDKRKEAERNDNET